MKKAFLLASFSLLLMVVLTLGHANHPAWADYQREYFAAQITELRFALGQVRDPEEREKIEAEIAGYQNREPEIVNLVLPDGEVERCQTCHLGIEEISASHPSDTFGCAVCHGGNPLSLDRETAHKQMLGGGHPGALTVASLSCGGAAPDGTACHSGNPDTADNQVDTVKTSLMATKAGELSMVRQIFGVAKTPEVPKLEKGETAFSFPNPLPGRDNEEAFRQNCLSQCHQSEGDLLLTAVGGGPFHADDKAIASASAPAAASASGAGVLGNGCESCHVLTNPTHTYAGEDTAIKDSAGGRGMEHRLTTQIPYTQCNQCHNQGTHDPLQMQFTVRADIEQVNRDWQAGDTVWADRVQDYYLPGELFARCEVSLDCIDCHTRDDAMGDGESATSQHETVHIQCLDCHGTKEQAPLTRKITASEDLKDLEQKQFSNPDFPDLEIGEEILATSQGEDLPYIRREGEEWIQSSRLTGKTFKIPQVLGSACEQDPAEQEADSCHRCHTGTVPPEP